MSETPIEVEKDAKAITPTQQEVNYKARFDELMEDLEMSDAVNAVKHAATFGKPEVNNNPPEYKMVSSDFAADVSKTLEGLMKVCPVLKEFRKTHEIPDVWEFVIGALELDALRTPKWATVLEGKLNHGATSERLKGLFSVPDDYQYVPPSQN